MISTMEDWKLTIEDITSNNGNMTIVMCLALALTHCGHLAEVDDDLIVLFKSLENAAMCVFGLNLLLKDNENLDNIGKVAFIAMLAMTVAMGSKKAILAKT